MADEATTTGEGISPEHVVAGVALLTSLVAILSFTYDWGYFTALGITFAKAPTTIADHVRSGLVMASIGVPLWFLSFAAHLFLLRVEDRGHFDEWVKSSANPARARIWVAVLRIGPALLTVGLLGWLVGDWEDNKAAPDLGTLFTILGAAFIVLWPVFVIWAFKRPRVKERFSPLSHVAAMVVPRFLVIFFWLGFIMGEADEDSTFPTVVSIDQACQAETETCPKAAPVRVYRAFGEWFLVGDSSGAYWVRSAHVDRIQAPQKPTSSGFLCELFGKACGVPEDEASPAEPRPDDAMWASCGTQRQVSMPALRPTR